MKSTEAKLPNPAEVERKRKPFRDWRGAVTLLVMGLAGLIGARLGHLWIAFDVFSQFAAQFLFLTLASIFAMASPRYKGLVAITFTVLMMLGYGLWPQIVSSKPNAIEALNAGEQQLKVASFNTYALNQNYTGIVASIEAIDADVVTLIEMEGDKSVVLTALKAKYPYQTDCNTQRDCHLAIISKFPLSDVTSKVHWEGPPMISASLGPQFNNLRVIGIHTTRFPHSRAQFTQVNALVKTVETISARVIMMGDFNSTPFSRINQTISTGLGLTRLSSLPSWPANYGFPQLAIDHIFVSPDIRLLGDERIGDNAGSDHFPISVVLAVPKS